MKTFLYVNFFLSFIAADISLLQSQIITHHNPVFQPGFQKPQVSVLFNDPKFNSQVQRITDAKNQGLAGLFPDYSKRQAWNSDGSLLMLRSGGGEVLIYNAANFQFIKTLPSNFTGLQDIFWHPFDPETIYFFADNTFNAVNPLTEQMMPLHTFPGYIYVTTRAEGNLSYNGSLVALVGYDASWNVKDFFVYSISGDSVAGSMNVTGTNAENLDWISISPLGNYVIVNYADNVTGQFHGVEVYDKQFNLVWQKPLGAGHSDLGIDINGKEMLIMDYYDANTNFTYIKKFYLEDGSETNLLALSALFDMHESCRNIDRAGWVYISTFDYVGRLTDDSLSWLPFEDEIFALKTDRSGDVQRLAHHHSRRFSPVTPDPDNSVYFSEPHATVKHDGNQVLFGSNWRQDMEQDSSIDAYIADISNILMVEGLPDEKKDLKVYPNPFSANATVEFVVPPSDSFSPLTLEIFDPLGKKIKTVYENELIPGKYILTFEDTYLSNGIYFLTLKSAGVIRHEKIEIIR